MALALVVIATTLGGCARRAERIVDRSVPVSVRSGALVFDGPGVQKELENQGYPVDVLRWEYARNNDAVSASTHQRAFGRALYRDSTWYGQPAPKAPFPIRRGTAIHRTTPILSPARERWFNPPY